MEGLRCLLENSGDLRVASMETTLAEGMEAIRLLRPDVALVDKALGLHGIVHWIEALRAAGSRTAVVVWGSFLSASESLRLLQSGASGVLRRSAALASITTCLRTVADGGSWVEEDAPRAPDPPVRTGPARLTSREKQVLALVERGMRNKDVALALGISPGTVKIHLKHIFEKTGIRGRYGLAVTAMKEKSAHATALPHFV